MSDNKKNTKIKFALMNNRKEFEWFLFIFARTFGIKRY